MLRSGADPVEAVKLPSATLDYALDGAQHGVLLTTLMRSYRLGHAATSRHLRAILAKHAADADELTAATDLCSAWLFAYVDTALCLVEDVYVTERERWIRSAAASQAEALNTILSGQPIDIDVAGRRLRHDLRRVHVAAVAWLDAHEEGRNTLALLEAAIRDIAAAIGTQRPLIQPLGTLSVAAWISTSSPVPSRVLDELRFRTATAPGVRVAIGEPARDIAGFRASHVEALEAQRIARLAGRREGSITRYGDISLRALATANIDQARAFVARELGSLAAGRRHHPSARRDGAHLPRRKRQPRQNRQTTQHPREHRELPAAASRGTVGAVSGQAHPRVAGRTRPGRPRRRDACARLDGPGQCLQGLRSVVLRGPAEEGLGLVGIHHDRRPAPRGRCLLQREGTAAGPPPPIRWLAVAAGTRTGRPPSAAAIFDSDVSPSPAMLYAPGGATVVAANAMAAATSS